VKRIDSNGTRGEGGESREDARECPQHSSSGSLDFHGNQKPQSNCDSVRLPELFIGEGEKRYQCLCKRDLIRLLCRQVPAFDRSDLQVLASFALQRLRTLQQRAREGKCVEEASEFARWLLESGVLKLLTTFAREAGEELAGLMRDTVWDCEEQWRGKGGKPWVAKSEVEAINAKLDALFSLAARKTKIVELPEGKALELPESLD